jgi:UDP-N-acetylglucosamine 2-epimerase (non-hydrolysing)
MAVLGTRPEIIRLSLVTKLLDKSADLTVVHTGQNFDDRLDGLFFRELGVRAPDFHLGIRADSFGDQAGKILAGTEALMLEHRPDRVLILGDTNSGLCSIVARRLGIPVYHMEAGNRCFDDRVPEEVNRRVIDHSSTVLLPYTNRSRDNLLREGIAPDRILVTGNPIKQVMDSFEPQISKSGALKQLGVSKKGYFLVTMHRAENVDREDTLRALVNALVALNKEYSLPVICSLHPRTKSKLEKFGIDFSQAGLKFMEPFGFFDFVNLEKSAFCVISDSGTVQEEACIMGVPNVTIREATERPETVECGSNVLAGSDPERIRAAVRLVTSRPVAWTPPPEYMEPNVAETVVGIVTAFRQPDRAEVEWQSGLRFPALPS